MSELIGRRDILTSGFALIFAPAVVRVSSLMRVRQFRRDPNSFLEFETPMFQNFSKVISAAEVMTVIFQQGTEDTRPIVTINGISCFPLLSVDNVYEIYLGDFRAPC